MKSLLPDLFESLYAIFGFIVGALVVYFSKNKEQK